MSRQQIGGVVGAVVGGVAGAYGSFGFGTGAGIQYGYLIGPALGTLESFPASPEHSDQGDAVEHVEAAT